MGDCLDSQNERPKTALNYNGKKTAFHSIDSFAFHSAGAKAGRPALWNYAVRINLSLSP